MHGPEPVLENETHKLLWDLTYKRFTKYWPTTRSYKLEWTNDNKKKKKEKKGNLQNYGLDVPADFRVKLKEC